MQAAQDPVIQQQQAELQIEREKIKQDQQEALLDAKTDIEKTKMRNDLERERLKQQKDLAEAKMQVDLIKTDKLNRS